MLLLIHHFFKCFLAASPSSLLRPLLAALGVHHSAIPQDHHCMWHKMLRLGSHTDLDFRPISGSPQLCDLRTVEPISTAVKQNTKGQLRGCWGQEARHGMCKCFIHSDPASHSLLTGKQEGLAPGVSRLLASSTRLRAMLSVKSPMGFPCVTQRFSHCNQINTCSFEIKAKERMIASFH